jgi:hypothetical protein
MKKAIYLLPLLLACKELTVLPEPQFSPLEISSISPYSAFVETKINTNGEIEDLGLAVGQDSLQFTVFSIPPTTQSSTKRFSKEITELKPNTKYYIKSFVRIKGKIHYSPNTTFTTPSPEGLQLNTGTAIDITYAGARLQGQIIDPGNLKISEYGLEWGKNELAEPVSRYSLDEAITTYPKSFQYFAGNLDPNTVYYYRSYAKAGSEKYYGDIKSFTTGEHFFPQLQTGTAVTGETSATLHGRIDKKGSHPIKEYGIVYGKSPLPTLQNGRMTLTAEPKAYPYPFFFELQELSAATTYHYRSYVTMNGLTVYGEDKTFTTGMVTPGITTLHATQISTEGALLNARLESTGTFAPSEVGIEYGHTPDVPLNKVKFQTFDIPAPLLYNVALKGLMDNQTYYYRAYVLTKGQMYYGELKKFTTLKAMPIRAITSAKTTDLGINGLGVEAEIHAGSYTITEHGFQYAFQASAPAQKIIVKKSGEFPYKITTTIPYPGCGKTIHFRAYALGEKGYTVYGEKIDFQTAACV